MALKQETTLRQLKNWFFFKYQKKTWNLHCFAHPLTPQLQSLSLNKALYDHNFTPKQQTQWNVPFGVLMGVLSVPYLLPSIRSSLCIEFLNQHFPWATDLDTTIKCLHFCWDIRCQSYWTLDTFVHTTSHNSLTNRGQVYFLAIYLWNLWQ